MTEESLLKPLPRSPLKGREQNTPLHFLERGRGRGLTHSPHQRHNPIPPLQRGRRRLLFADLLRHVTHHIHASPQRPWILLIPFRIRLREPNDGERACTAKLPIEFTRLLIEQPTLDVLYRARTTLRDDFYFYHSRYLFCILLQVTVTSRPVGKGDCHLLLNDHPRIDHECTNAPSFIRLFVDSFSSKPLPASPINGEEQSPSSSKYDCCN